MSEFSWRAARPSAALPPSWGVFVVDSHPHIITPKNNLAPTPHLCYPFPLKPPNIQLHLEVLMAAEDASPREIAIENLVTALRNRAKGLSLESATAAASYFLDHYRNPRAPLTVRALTEVASVTKPTARRYRDIMIAAYEHPAAEVARGDASASPEAIAEAASTASAHAATHSPFEKKRISNSEFEEILDATVRRLHEENAPGSAMKAMLELKMKFSQIEAASREHLIDPHKIMGPDGMRALVPTFLQRIQLLLAHRREMPAIGHGILEAALTALRADLGNADAFPDSLTEAIEAFVAEWLALSDRLYWTSTSEFIPATSFEFGPSPESRTTHEDDTRDQTEVMS